MKEHQNCDDSCTHKWLENNSMTITIQTNDTDETVYEEEDFLAKYEKYLVLGEEWGGSAKFIKDELRSFICFLREEDNQPS